MNIKWRWIVVSAVVLGAVAFFACGDEDEDRADFGEIIEAGKWYLVVGDAPAATEAFYAALDRDGTNSDAQFGASLANVLSFVKLVDNLIGLLGDLAAADPMEPVDDPSLSPKADEQVGDLIQDFLADIGVAPLVDNDRFYIDLSARPDFLFTLDGAYDLEVLGLTLVSMEGELDHGELEFEGALSSLLLGVFQIVLAHDINFDISSLSLEFPEDGDIVKTIDVVIELVEGLLNDPNYPNFLYLDDDGADQMRSAGISLGDTFLRLKTMIEVVRAETDNQDDDPIRYLDWNGDGVWTEGEPLYISGLGEIDAELTDVILDLSGALATAFFDGTRFDVDPANPNPLTLDALNGLLMYLDVFDRPILGDRFGIPLGPFFAEPTPDGLRSLLTTVINAWNLIEGLLPSDQTP